jgi:hypothetical protein
MCVGIALAVSEVPVLLIEKYGLMDRVYDGGGERVVRFLWRARPTMLPVWWNGKLQVVRWGNKERHEKKLPPCGWTWEETVASGWWSQLAPEEVVIPASFGLMNGVWFKVKQGMRGLLVKDRAGEPVVFMLTQPATRYYEIMCRADFMPVLVDEVI